ncbi:hypothetical protein LEP1GSC194_1569 [Leptospira alstonii serovar Sichuan str. 79601]|uniref:Uncharacterized protein n=1 Tax=Leptospira alstonii serovar Sichuan str. 79601 TaxID=1218565 RepID=M6CN08_9LEPT|nr:hypothetical protein LEP1GSC194_1569 [Leptospira alstonii serovar Sichuan str. 79601]
MSAPGKSQFDTEVSDRNPKTGFVRVESFEFAKANLRFQNPF